jgi:hypothetical protein
MFSLQRFRYEAYLLQPLESDPALCARRNIHARTLKELVALAQQWEAAPPSIPVLNVKPLLSGQLQGGCELGRHNSMLYSVSAALLRLGKLHGSNMSRLSGRASRKGCAHNICDERALFNQHNLFPTWKAPRYVQVIYLFLLCLRLCRCIQH